jgi:ankyrin repeat protein
LQWNTFVYMTNLTKDEIKLCSEAHFGDLKLVKSLVEKGIDVHIENDYLFRYACQNGHLEIVKFVTDMGVDISNLNTGFCWASQMGRFKIVKFLFEKGADIHAEDDYAIRFTPEQGHFEIVKFLLEKGADISLVPEKDRDKINRYLAVCERTRTRATNKIGSWWIPICYRLRDKNGELRMAKKSWERVEKMYKSGKFV